MRQHQAPFIDHSSRFQTSWKARGPWRPCSASIVLTCRMTRPSRSTIRSISRRTADRGRGRERRGPRLQIDDAVQLETSLGGVRQRGPLPAGRRHRVPHRQRPEVCSLPGIQPPHRHPDRSQGKRRRPDPRAITQVRAQWGESSRIAFYQVTDKTRHPPPGASTKIRAHGPQSLQKLRDGWLST